MLNRKLSLQIRKIHRYLGLFLGIQFLLWTISGIYFSWTDIDAIHGDHYKNLNYEPMAFDNLLSPTSMAIAEPIKTLEIRDINQQPYYFVNNEFLYHARTGQKKNELSEDEAVYIAKNNMQEGLAIVAVEKISTTGKHHEYREKLLPAYVISYETDDNLKAYVSLKDAKFQTVRHDNWRWFDFLWMTHTMDYEGRDDFNTTVLRAFSLLGLITVLSGFALWYVSSPTIRNLLTRNT